MSSGLRILTKQDKHTIGEFLETARDENNDFGEGKKKYTYDEVIKDLQLYLDNIDRV